MLRRLIQGSIRVHPSVTNPRDQRRSELLAAALVIMTGVFLSLDTAYALTTPGYAPPYYGYAFLATSYALNRAGRYRLAAALVLTMFTLVPLVHVYSGDARFPQISLSYLSLGPGLGALLLPARGIALMSAIDLLALLVMPLLAPTTLAPTMIVGPLSLTAMSSLIALLAVRQRDQLERDRIADIGASEERLRMALDAARMGIWDVDKANQRTVTTPHVAAIFGLSPDTHVDLARYLATTHPDDRAHVAETFSNPKGLPSPTLLLTHRVLTPDGAVRWVEVTGRAVRDPHGVETRRVGTIVDVTDRKLLEEQLAQAQKLDAIGRLAGGVAHDFNNLLTVILGNVGLLRFAPAAKSKDIEPAISDIEQAATSAAKLTQQLLAFSRRAMVHPRVVILDDVLRGATSMIARIIGEDVHTVLKLSTNPWAVRVDDGQIEQVVLNLATNARDAMPSGGTLTVETKNVTLSTEQAQRIDGARAGDYVTLDVSDTGAGMGPEIRNRIFEPFFTTKPVGKGTGLGLAMVFGVVTQAEGFIDVHTQPGKGSSFRIYFPRTLETRGEPTQSVPTQAKSEELILLVEDERSVREVTARMLQLGGYRVHAVDSPAAAHAYWASHGADVALLMTDLVMPGGGGRQLTDDLRAHRPKLPVLFVTGYDPTSDEVAPHSVTLGKPFSSAQLLGAARSLIDQGKH